jgi:hypothetical protein
MPDELLLVPTIIRKGQYPLYDVAVRFSELARGKAFDMVAHSGAILLETWRRDLLQ